MALCSRRASRATRLPGPALCLLVLLASVVPTGRAEEVLMPAVGLAAHLVKPEESQHAQEVCGVEQIDALKTITKVGKDDLDLRLQALADVARPATDRPVAADILDDSRIAQGVSGPGGGMERRFAHFGQHDPLPEPVVLTDQQTGRLG